MCYYRERARFDKLYPNVDQPESMKVDEEEDYDNDEENEEEVDDETGNSFFPKSLRGNEPTDHDTIDAVLSHYHRDGISRPSPNGKDVILINGISVGKRFM